jgi:hypothetical protein
MNNQPDEQASQQQQDLNDQDFVASLIAQLQAVQAAQIEQRAQSLLQSPVQAGQSIYLRISSLNPRRPTSHMAEQPCQICNQPGHSASNCPFRNGELDSALHLCTENQFLRRRIKELIKMVDSIRSNLQKLEKGPSQQNISKSGHPLRKCRCVYVRQSVAGCNKPWSLPSFWQKHDRRHFRPRKLQPIKEEDAVRLIIQSSIQETNKFLNVRHMNIKKDIKKDQERLD